MKLSEYIKEFGDKPVDVEKLSEFIIEDKVFEPKANEDYFYIIGSGAVGKTTRTHDVDEEIIGYQQVYRTEAEAEFARDKAIFLEFMRKEFLRNSDVIDWGDKKQNKWYIVYAHENEEVNIHVAQYLQFDVLHTTDRTWLYEFVNDYYDDIKRYYFEVKE